MPSVAESMMALFEGHSGVHGTHGVPTRKADSSKWEIKSTARTLREPVTLEMWEQHLAGTRPLGVVPIREDGTCAWGSIDIDEYDDELLSVVQRVSSARLPLVPCRSKSGGLHLFAFLTEPTEAAVVQSVLTDLAAQLGFSGSEIFPKQTRVISERGDLGNWMVMPYFGDTYGGKIKEQVGLKKTGAEMTVEEFIRVAGETRVEPSRFQDLARARGRTRANGRAAGPFSDGPPCLQHLAAMKVAPGGQNNALLMMGIYYKRAHPEDWKTRLEAANRDFLVPPGSAEGVTGVIRSLERKEYEYTCRNEPMSSHCDSGLCRTRRHGVGGEGSYPTITSISKLDTDPALWFIDVDGHRIEATTDQLQNYKKFHALCIEQCERAYQPMKEKDWFNMLNEAMQTLIHIDAPYDVSAQERFREHLEEFLTNRAAGERKEDLLSGRPWEDVEAGRRYFRLRDLMRFLEKEGVRDMRRGSVSQIVRRMGGGHEFFNLSGKGFNVFWVPSDVVSPTPEVPLPRPTGEPI